MTSGTPVPGHAVPCRVIPRAETTGGIAVTTASMVCASATIAPTNAVRVTRPVPCRWRDRAHCQSRTVATSGMRAPFGRERCACQRVAGSSVSVCSLLPGSSGVGGAAVPPVLVASAEEGRMQPVSAILCEICGERWRTPVLQETRSLSSRLPKMNLTPCLEHRRRHLGWPLHRPAGRRGGGTGAGQRHHPQGR
jgi:hypothetical protein